KTWFAESIQKEHRVVGTLNPIRWNHKGKVIEYAIFSEHEEDIIIEYSPSKKTLDRFLNKKILAIGYLRKNKYGEKFIKIKSIKEFSSQGTPTPVKKIRDEVDWYLQEYPLNLPENDYQLF